MKTNNDIYEELQLIQERLNEIQYGTGHDDPKLDDSISRIHNYLMNFDHGVSGFWPYFRGIYSMTKWIFWVMVIGFIITFIILL